MGLWAGCVPIFFLLWMGVQEIGENVESVARSVSTSRVSRCEQPPQNDGGHTYRTEDENAEDEARHVLELSLQFVPEHGWSRQTLAAGAEASGLPGISHGLFPKGGIELVHYFYTKCNSELAQQLVKEKAAENEEGEIKRKTSRFIRDAIITRLSMVHPYMDRWPEAMGLMALPQNAPQSLKNLGHLMDDIWYHAGDEAVRFDWYTKRLSLAAVYKSTEFFMLQDESEDLVDTCTFLDRRMDDVKNMGKVVGKAQNAGDLLCHGLWSASLTLQNVLGLNYRRR